MTRDEEKPVIHLKHQSRSRLHRLAIQRGIEAEEEIKRFKKDPRGLEDTPQDPETGGL